jgi:N-acetylneuraminic acid mutarotase
MKNKKSNKTNLFYALCIAFTSITHAQSYTWMKGTTTIDQPGLYGTLGVPSPTNNPGSRDGASSWKDASGNFWLFGGNGFDAAGNYDFLNDLWKYSPVTNEWTWMKGDSVVSQDGVYGALGVAASSNNPGARGGAVTWADASGNLWMFGGAAYDAFSNLGEINDLWKYNIASNQWTWMKGSDMSGQFATYGSQGVAANANVPGAAFYGTGWVDATGNFWLFGGEGNDANSYGDLHDLWKYNATNNQWTWMKGSGIANQNGVYGTIAVAAPTNLPGSRLFCNSWADASGNLWLFGGYGLDISNSSTDFLNDLWKYSITTNEWTWIKGSNTAAQNGVYGTMGVSAPSNEPGSRIGAVSWKNSTTGDFYLFGGTGYFSGTNIDDMNDLWKYSPTSNEWTWIKGDDQMAQNGTYGIQGVTASANTPGSRSAATSWVDNSDNLWMFGGLGIADNTQSYGEMNDLWKFSNCVSPTVVISASQATICSGLPSNISVSGANTYVWNTTQTLTSISITPTITTTYSVIGTDSNGCSGTASYTQEVYPLNTATILSTAGALVCKGDSHTLTLNGANTYTWSTGVSSTSIVVSYSALGVNNITCLTKDVNGCFYNASITKTVSACTAIDENKNITATLVLYPNPSNGVFNITTSSYEAAKLIVFNSLGQKVIEHDLVSEHTQVKNNLQAGVYIYQLIQNNRKVGNGKLIVE